jgi:hypothetical protein
MKIRLKDDSYIRTNGLCELEEIMGESDVSISIYTETEIITRKSPRRIMTIEQIQTDLGRFKSAIDCLCDASDALALAEKRKKKLRSRLTESESNAYFEELMYEAEKK